MHELVTDAFVLGCEAGHGWDRKVDLYADRLGRVSARVVGGRRERSRLAPHLDLGTFAAVRLVRKNKFTVADALSLGRLPATFLPDLFCVRSLSPEAVFEANIWSMLAGGLSGGGADCKILLKFLGYDSARARCGVCDLPSPERFLISEHIFLCGQCGAGVPERAAVRVFN